MANAAQPPGCRDSIGVQTHGEWEIQHRVCLMGGKQQPRVAEPPQHPSAPEEQSRNHRPESTALERAHLASQFCT